MTFFTNIFKPHTPIPAAYRSNFFHLILDIGWFGILSGSSMAFMTVYAARLGADPFQIGLMGAVPALMSLTLAIPSGQWLQRQRIDRAVFWTSVWFRLGYLFWIPLPWLFNAEGQIWALVGLLLLTGIPGTALAVGFNALFAEAVPPEWRAYVASIRNIMLSILFVLTSLISGWILDSLPFPLGYQVVFGIGFIGAAMSSYHLYYVRPATEPEAGRPQTPIGDRARPGFSKSLGDGSRPGIGLRFFARVRWREIIRFDIWQTGFRKIFFVLLAFHLAQYLGVPLFPLYFVNDLALTDQQIGIGTAAFYGAVLIGSFQLTRLSARYGHKKVAAISASLMGIYPIFLAVSSTFWHYLAISLWGGLIWAMVAGALPNYLLENVPADDRPAHLAWYNIALNISILAGSLLGPLFAESLSLVAALVITGVLRTAAGLGILKWG